MKLKLLLSFLLIICLIIPYNSHAQEKFQKLVDDIIVKSGMSLSTVDFYQTSTFMEMPYKKEYPEAVVYNGEKMLLFNETFKARLDSYVVSDWAALLQLTHEMAHHLKKHEFPLSKEDEERADEFAGEVLNEYGASRKQLTEALETIAESNHAINSKTKVADRLEWLVNGWQSASVIDIGVSISEENNGGQEDNTISDADMTAEKVLRRSLEALGGIDKIQKIDRLFQKQKNVIVLTAEGTDFHSTVQTDLYYLDHKTLIKKNTPLVTFFGEEKVYSEFALKDEKIYARYSPTAKWVYSDLRILNMVFNNINYIHEDVLLSKLDKINYWGVEEIEGKEYYVLETPQEIISAYDGGEKMERKKYYYSKETGLLIYLRWWGKSTGLDANSWVEFSDYRYVSGIQYSFKQSSNTEMVVTGSKTNIKTETTFSEIKINPDFDESMFNVE